MEFVELIERTPDNDIVQRLATILHQEEKELFHYPPHPPSGAVANLTASPRPTHRNRYWLITERDEDIGRMMLRQNLISDTTHLGLQIYIKPEYRQEGRAISSMKFLMDHFPDDVDTIVAYYLQRLGKEDHWLKSWYEKMGLKPVYSERINTSDLSNFDPKEIQEIANQLEEEAARKGFTLHWVADGAYNQVPGLDFTEYIQMVGRIWNDMPTEDASWEEEPISEEIYQAIFTHVAELNGFIWSLVAIHESGQPVGLTDIYVFRDNPARIYQGDTGVDKVFRGNGLGRTLKYKMLARILTDEKMSSARYITTGNANSNEHMLRINEELGFNHDYSQLWYEIPRSDFETYLADK